MSESLGGVGQLAPSFVPTVKGPLPVADLRKLAYIAKVNPKNIVVALEWFLGDEMVRRDVWVNVFQGEDLTPALGATNG